MMDDSQDRPDGASAQPTGSDASATRTALLLPFAELCRQLAQTTKKLEKRALMAAYLGSLTVEDAARAALYLAGAPFAETDRRRLQVGGSTLSKAVAELSGATPPALHAAYRRHGDLGEAAFDLLTAMLPAPPDLPLTLTALEDAFTALALARGPAAKLQLLLALFRRATPLEAKYLIKLASGDMRTGVKQSLVEEAVAATYGAPAPSVRHAVMLNGNLAEVVAMAAGATLDQARMRLFHPLGFMLASPVDSVEEALARFAEEVATEVAAGKVTGAANQTEAASELTADEAEAAPPALDITLALLAEAPPALRAAQLEDKYDGIRAQLHCGDPTQPGRVGLFSRTREDLSESFPELIEAFASFGEEVILDGEILAWKPATKALFGELGAVESGKAEAPTMQSPGAEADASNPSAGEALARDKPKETAAAEAALTHATPGRALPFASLQQRLGRKRVTAEMRGTTPVVFMAFDLLYHAGELLLEHPLADRRSRLESLVSAHAARTDGSPPAMDEPAQSALFAAPPPVAEAPGFSRLMLAPAVQLTGADQLDAAYRDARTRGNEGVMLKAAASLYQPGRRGLAWLKLKRELASLDVVITGAEFGHGRRAGVLSDYTFAVRAEVVAHPTDPAAPLATALLNVGKAYSGLTDREIEDLSTLLHEQTIEDYGGFRTVEPVVVLEVAFNNVMRSTRHASGFALRFPRILRIRTDKPVGEIDTLARVEEIYASQPDKPVEG